MPSAQRRLQVPGSKSVSLWKLRIFLPTSQGFYTLDRFEWLFMGIVKRCYKDIKFSSLL